MQNRWPLGVGANWHSGTRSVACRAGGARGSRPGSESRRGASAARRTQDLFQARDVVVLFERGRELRQRGADSPEVELHVRFDDALDVRHVPGTKCQRLYHDDVLGCRGESRSRLPRPYARVAPAPTRTAASRSSSPPRSSSGGQPAARRACSWRILGRGRCLEIFRTRRPPSPTLPSSRPPREPRRPRPWSPVVCRGATRPRRPPRRSRPFAVASQAETYPN